MGGGAGREKGGNAGVDALASVLPLAECGALGNVAAADWVDVSGMSPNEPERGRFCLPGTSSDGCVVGCQPGGGLVGGCSLWVPELVETVRG